MQPEKQRKHRRAEIWTGLFLIIIVFSYIASLLLDFKFVSPYATVQEDLSYLAEHVQNQLFSSIAWGITALMTLLAIPFYLMVFRRAIRVFPYINSLFLAGAAAGFMLMAVEGLELHGEMVQLQGQGADLTDEQVNLKLLSLFRNEQLVRYIGSTFVGLFSVGLGITKFRIRGYPLLSTLLLVTAGPVLIFFNWYNPDHLARTVAMAGILVGIALLSIRLINRGLNTT